MGWREKFWRFPGAQHRSAMQRPYSVFWIAAIFCAGPALAQGVEDLYDEGLKAYNKRQFGEAATYLQTILSSNPNFARAHNLMGKIYYHENKVSLAMTEYNKAVAAEPRLAEAYFNIGVVHFDQGNVKEAEKEFDQAVHLDPGSVEY